jgi:hypothetical protein
MTFALRQVSVDPGEGVAVAGLAVGGRDQLTATHRRCAMRLGRRDHQQPWRHPRIGIVEAPPTCQTPVIPGRMASLLTPINLLGTPSRR